MNDLLANPAIQAGVLPFAAALAVAWPLARTRWAGLAAAAALVALLAATIGFALQPLTAPKKLVLVSLGLLAAALLLQVRRVPPSAPAVGALMLAAGAGALWMLQRVLAQLDAQPALLAGAGAFALAAAQVGGAAVVGRRSPLLAAVLAAMLGFASGALALLGASALLAQIGIALGAAAAALALVLLLRGAAGGWADALPVAAAAALVGAAATATGALPWFSLLPLPLAALAVHFVPHDDARRWRSAIVGALAALAPLLAALALAWRAAASPGA